MKWEKWWIHSATWGKKTVRPRRYRHMPTVPKPGYTQSRHTWKYYHPNPDEVIFGETKRCHHDWR